MLRIRPYNSKDAAEVLSWCGSEKMLYQWTAGVMGGYPLTVEAFSYVEELMPFIAFDETGNVGFFSIRNKSADFSEVRFGFLILNPEKRGRGIGKQMLSVGLKFAFEMYGAKRATIGVFENNPAAYHCYKSVGFKDRTPPAIEAFDIQGEKWNCIDLVFEKEA